MRVAEIKPLLKVRGITQAELAARLGISRVHVTQMLSGKRRMSVDTMNAIEALLGAAPTRGVAETRADFADRPRVRFVTLEEARATRNAPRVRLTEEERAAWLREMREIGEIGRRLPRVTDMTDDEILGYDEMP